MLQRRRPTFAKPFFLARPLAALVVAAVACGSEGAGDGPGSTPSDVPAVDPSESGTPASGAWLVAGDDIDPVVRERIAAHLGAALGKRVTVTRADALPSQLASDALVVAIGSTTLSATLVPDAELTKLPPESYVVRSGVHAGAALLVARGSAKSDHPHGNIGAMHGAYVLLEGSVSASSTRSRRPCQPNW